MNDEILKKYTQIVEKNPFAAQFGIELLEIHEGYVSTKVKIRKEFGNIFGNLHGGFLFSIADTIAGVAATTYGQYVTTLNGSIQYLKAGRNTEYIFCEAQVIKAGKTITVVQLKIKDDHDLLLNTAEFTYFNLNKEPEE